MARTLWLDIDCGACERAGDPDPPRLARFWRDSDGRVGVEPFTPKGPRPGREPPPALAGPQGHRAFPVVHRRPDGGETWQLDCPHGHHKPISHERVRAAFEAFPPGQDHRRIAL
jgi:hypothetical protein